MQRAAVAAGAAQAGRTLSRGGAALAAPNSSSIASSQGGVTTAANGVRCCSMCVRPRGSKLGGSAQVLASFPAKLPPPASWTLSAPAVVLVPAALAAFPSPNAPSPSSSSAAVPSTSTSSFRPRATGSAAFSASRTTLQSGATSTRFLSAAHFAAQFHSRALAAAPPPPPPAASASSFVSPFPSAAAARASPASSSSSSPALDTIHMHGMQFFSYHGVWAEETRSGQPFLLDLDLRTDLSAAGVSDDLASTVNYAAVYDLAARIMIGPPHHKLLESLAITLVDAILAHFPPVQEISVRLRKPKVAIPGLLDYMGISITRSRAQRDAVAGVK